MKDKAKIPSPDKYLCNVHRKNFNDITKKSKIYAFERQSTFNTIIKDAKKTPGTGKYETTNFDEKRIKPPRGIHKASVERFTVLDEAAVHGKSIPDKYNDVPLVSKIVFHVIYLFIFFLEKNQTKRIRTSKVSSRFREKKRVYVKGLEEKR